MTDVRKWSQYRLSRPFELLRENESQVSRLLVSLTLATFACNASGALLSTPVILISVDTLRADHLGRQTPHLDTLARSGSVFSQVSTPFPLTLPGTLRFSARPILSLMVLRTTAFR